MKKPCRECPFRKTSLPGWLGRATPEGFIDTVMADHRMPCHLEVDYEDPEWKAQAAVAPECAGAADFFANICKVSRDRKRTPGKRNAEVFDSPRAFVEYHSK